MQGIQSTHYYVPGTSYSMETGDSRTNVGRVESFASQQLKFVSVRNLFKGLKTEALLMD